MKKTSSKRRILALILTLALAICMMVPSFAAEGDEGIMPLLSIPVTGSGSRCTVRSYQFSGQYLNIWGSNTSAIRDGTNVTTYARAVGDPLQEWRYFTYTDGSHRLAANNGWGYSLGHVSGGNAQLMSCSYDYNSSDVAQECAINAVGSRFQLKYNTSLYLAVQYASISGHDAHNAFWATLAQAPDNYSQWSIAVF